MKVEYDQTRTPGVTHLISVGEEPGGDSTGAIIGKSAVVGLGVFVAVVSVPAKHAAWVGIAAFGAALAFFSSR